MFTSLQVNMFILKIKYVQINMKNLHYMYK